MTDPMPAVRSILGMPPEPADHKAEAEEIITHRASANDPHGLALVHATLYLAEQQRIANLIDFQGRAYVQATVGTGGVIIDAFGHRIAAETFNTIQAEIRNGLGL